MTTTLTCNKPRKSSGDLGLDLASTVAGCTERDAVTNGSEHKSPESPRQQTTTLPSEAQVTESWGETTNDLVTKATTFSARARRGSATMRSFLNRVMHTPSDNPIRIAPIVHGETSTTSSTPLITVGETPPEKTASFTSHSLPAHEPVRHCESAGTKEEEDRSASIAAVAPTGTASDPEPMTMAPNKNISSDDGCREEPVVGLCDVFLNSSLQLLQVQSDAKQRVRQLWTCAQKLRWENQLSDSGLESLHQELLTVMKALTVEKLDGPRTIKAGYLTLVQAPPAVVAANLMQRGVAAATKSLFLGNSVKTSLDQRMWVSVSEEQCRMELVPSTRTEERPLQSQPSQSNDATVPGIGKFKLPTSISWLLSDPLQGQGKDDDTALIGRTAIKLQGCQVRRLPVSAPGSEVPRIRFQVLVPSSDPSLAAPVAPSLTTSVVSTAVVPDNTLASAYGVYVFEIPMTDLSSMALAEHERAEWIRAIDRVCGYHLYALETQLREACYMLQFRDILASNFPVCVPLTWLRNRLEKMPRATLSATMSAQQHANYQYQQLQRRSSRNLTMVQIVKDLERDRILVDRKLLISCAGRRESDASSDSSMPSMTDSTVVERDSVADIVKYLVGKAMAFARNVAATSKPTKSTPSDGKPPMASSGSDLQGVMSPSHRLAKFTEARALEFVERVLRGSSRTQSGGDIYDAISFFCQQRGLMICPMSHNAHPVQLNVVEDECPGDDSGDAFHIEIEVSMVFKVVEMPAMTPCFDDLEPDDALAMASPRDWAVLEGTLRRQFTLGKLSEPGSVTLKYIPDDEYSDECPNADPKS